MGRVWVIAGTIVLATGCSTPRAPDSSPPPSSSSSSSSAAPASAPPVAQPEAKDPTSPPDLQLQVLEERLAVGLAIQNRSDRAQSLSPGLQLERVDGKGSSLALALSSAQDCVRLRPGGEWLWPADWGLSLAPDQRKLDGLEGRYRFVVHGCGEGAGVLRSPPFELPVRYFGASGIGK